MARQHHRVPLGPLLGANGQRITDRAIGGTYMRGGAYNVECIDGEWWTRKGEQYKAVQIGSTIWRWIFDVNRDTDMTILANEFYALKYERSTGLVTNIYSPAVTENTTFTLGSATATSTTLRTAGQLILVGAGFTGTVYRVTAASGSGPYSITLDRPASFSATSSCRYLDVLARNVAGTAATHSNSNPFRGSAVVFEQLVSYTAGAVHGSSPAVTGGSPLLVITSNLGVPVAIDLATVAAPKRLFFYNTAIGTPAQIGSDTADDLLVPRGIWASVYKGRLWIGYASDPNGQYGSRTIWYSQVGDCLKWHTGIQGQTAAPNFVTFDGVGNGINEMQTLQDSIVIHREDTQVVGNATGGNPPFTFRENEQGIGIRTRTPSNRVVVANGAHYIWTQRGPAVFDGNRVTLIAREMYHELATRRMVGENAGIRFAVHDPINGRIYWFGGTRPSAALPATATVTYASGDQTENYCTCWVYDYLKDTSWFEDRPYACGGGVATLYSSNSIPRYACLSRIDGTVVGISSQSDSKDASLLDPGTSDSDVPVYAHVETPWLDFGSTDMKQLLAIETIERGARSGAIFEDLTSDATYGEDWWLNCKVYRDYNGYTDDGEFGTTYFGGQNPGDAIGVDRQPGFFIRRFTPRSHGRQFKLVFSNALTSAATAAATIYQGPFRIHDIFVEFTTRQGKTPHTDAAGTSISE